MKWGALSFVLVAVLAQPAAADSVLVAWPLSSTQAATFARDGVLSKFWYRWPGDSLHMTPQTHCSPDRCGFSGPRDANVSVKAAWAPSGLYLCFVVQDDRWVYEGCGTAQDADELDIYLDSKDAHTVFNCDDCHVSLQTCLTYCTQRFQTFVAAPPATDSLRFSHHNGHAWESVLLDCGTAVSQFGFSMDFARLGTSGRAVELFVPWSRFGCRTSPATGKRFAFTAGYNDKDASGDSPDFLRWRGADPRAWDATTVNYWGDILLGDSIAPPPPPPPPPPSNIPVLVAMPDSTTDRTPLLAWRPVAGAANYKVVIDNNADFSSPIATVYTRGDTTYTPETLLPYGTIYWKVSCNIDYGVYSQPGSFVVVEVVPPPTLIPFAYPSTTDPFPVLSWKPVAGAASYTVQLATDESFNTLLSVGRVAGATKFVPSRPLPVSQVCWRVASDRAPGKWSASDCFRIVPLPRPSVTLPAEMAVVSPHDLLAWTPFEDPSCPVSYELSVSLSDDFSSGVLCENKRVPDSVRIADAVPNAPYERMLFWRVRAVNAAGVVSSYSPTASFLLSQTGARSSPNTRLRNELATVTGAAGETLVRFSLESAADVCIGIYDVAGSVVKRLVNRRVEAGTYVVPWDGDERDGRAPCGVYVVRMSYGGRVVSRGVRLVR